MPSYDTERAGQRLFPVVIDERARDEPDMVWCSLPYDDADLSQGYEDITYAVFANAINKLSWFLVKNVGRPTNFESIAYFGSPDIRYHMMQMAAAKTGYKVLFSSQLNSRYMHLPLLEKTQCTTILSAVGVFVNDLLVASPRKLAHFVIPDLEDLLDHRELAPMFPYTKTFEEAQWDPYMILTTSGTTGNPKPVTFNHAMAATGDRDCLLPDVEGREHMLVSTRPGPGKRWLLPTAPYHLMSSFGAMMSSIWGRAIFIPGFRHRVPDTSDICSIIEHAGVSMGGLTPWMIEDIARKPNAEDYIKQFEWIATAGAVLSPYAWNMWGKHTTIQNIWGATEIGGVQYLAGDKGDQAHMFFDVVHSGMDFRRVEIEYAEGGRQLPVYEVVMTLTPESAGSSIWHASNRISLKDGPPYPEFAVGDIWTPHPDPEKARFAWRFIGRKDDLITLATGINLHPGPMERALSANPLVRAALVIGRRRLQPLALVELVEGAEPQDAKHAIWEAAISPQNVKIAAHARIAETHVVLVPAGAFIRTPKGSVQRKQTEEKFATEINAVYTQFGDQWQDRKERYGSISASTEIRVEFSKKGEGEKTPL